jgi:SAM-dependent methyltransferase
MAEPPEPVEPVPPAAPRETYTHGHHESVLRSHRARTVENSAAYLVPWLRAGARVLDVGCGPGTITVDLAARVAPGEVIGVDAVAEVLTLAREEADTAGRHNVRFDTGDVYALAFADDEFDIVHAHQVLQHLADPVAALVEMRRVCRPGGTIAVRDADYGGFTWYPELPELDEWMGLFQTVTRANGGEPCAGRRVLHWARAAGCADVRPSAGVWCFATPDERAWWAGSWADRTVGSAFGERALELGLATRADLERIAGGWREWSTAPDAWFAVLHGEVLAAP